MPPYLSWGRANFPLSRCLSPRERPQYSRDISPEEFLFCQRASLWSARATGLSHPSPLPVSAPVSLSPIIPISPQPGVLDRLLISHQLSSPHLESSGPLQLPALLPVFPLLKAVRSFLSAVRNESSPFSLLSPLAGPSPRPPV